MVPPLTLPASAPGGDDHEPDRGDQGARSRELAAAFDRLRPGGPRRADGVPAEALAQDLCRRALEDGDGGRVYRGRLPASRAWPDPSEGLVWRGLAGLGAEYRLLLLAHRWAAGDRALALELMARFEAEVAGGLTLRDREEPAARIARRTLARMARNEREEGREGHGARRVPARSLRSLQLGFLASPVRRGEVLALEAALRRLERSHPRVAHVAELVSFLDWTATEVRDHLGLSREEVLQDLHEGGALLRQLLRDAAGRPAVEPAEGPARRPAPAPAAELVVPPSVATELAFREQLERLVEAAVERALRRAGARARVPDAWPARVAPRPSLWQRILRWLRGR